jgi:lysozyme
MTEIDGVDISHFQGAVNFKRLKGAGCHFVFLKATDGVNFIDPMFRSNRQGAKSAGIPCGAYHFFRPQLSAGTQAAHFLDVVGALEPGDLFPVLDVEDDKQFEGIPPRHAADMVIAWMAQVEKNLGVPCILYADESIISNVLDGDVRLAQAGRLLWYAKYRSRRLVPKAPDPFRQLTLWQFSETGTRPGIVGKVDEDISFVPVAEFTRK